MALFVSKFQQIDFVIRPESRQDMPDGSYRIHPGKTVRLENGQLNTEDDEVIQVLRRHPEYGTPYLFEVSDRDQKIVADTQELERLRRELEEAKAALAAKEQGDEKKGGLAELNALRRQAAEMGIDVPKGAKAEELRSLIEQHTAE